MKNDVTMYANVNNLIALCHILDDFDDFSRSFSDFIKKEGWGSLKVLFMVSSGKQVFGFVKVKKFYQANKKVIDTINTYSNMVEFTYSNYNSLGEVSKYTDVSFFYQYILSHREDIDKILSVLEQIKYLGITNLDFNENSDFSGDKYSIDTDNSYPHNQTITYLDNMEIIPQYSLKVIEYRTTGSNYQIILKRKNTLPFSGYLPSRIQVNSLLFEPDRLPANLTVENPFDKIVSLKNGQVKSACYDIEKSVQLNANIADLYSKYNTLVEIVDGLRRTDTKEEFYEELLNLRNCLHKLESMSSKYDEEISEGSPLITKELLSSEKQKYLKRRYYS